MSFSNQYLIASVGVNGVNSDKDAKGRDKTVYRLGENTFGDKKGVSQIDELIDALQKARKEGLDTVRLDFRTEMREIKNGPRAGQTFPSTFLMVLKPGEKPGGNR